MGIILGSYWSNYYNMFMWQLCFALALQKKGGTFILKIFDIFTQATIDIIYILASLYKKVYIIKPCTSRTANSEKYIVCKDFKMNDTFELLTIFSNLYKTINTDVEIIRFLNELLKNGG